MNHLNQPRAQRHRCVVHVVDRLDEALSHLLHPRWILYVGEVDYATLVRRLGKNTQKSVKTQT
jgi:hypothetical protein